MAYTCLHLRQYKKGLFTSIHNRTTPGVIDNVDDVLACRGYNSNQFLWFFKQPLRESRPFNQRTVHRNNIPCRRQYSILQTQYNGNWQPSGKSKSPVENPNWGYSKMVHLTYHGEIGVHFSKGILSTVVGGFYILYTTRVRQPPIISGVLPLVKVNFIHLAYKTRTG